MTPRKFMAIVLRLSIVAGVGFGLFDSYQTLNEWDAQQTANTRNKIRYLCAANIQDDWLNKNTNVFGTVDVAPICGADADEKTFFVRSSEIAATRSGEDIYAGIGWRKPYDITKAFVAFVAGFIGTILLGTAMLALFIVGRWIVYGRR
jgi:hypothetical protein